MFKSLVVLALVGAAAAIGPTWTSVEDTPTLSHRTATALSLSWPAYFGIDRFYMGYLIVGGLNAITLGGFGIWALVDIIFTLQSLMGDSLIKLGGIVTLCSIAEAPCSTYIVTWDCRVTDLGL